MTDEHSNDHPGHPGDHEPARVIDRALDEARDLPGLGPLVEVVENADEAEHEYPGEDRPGGSPFGDAIRRFDEGVDAALEPWRNQPVVSAVMNAATNAGEFSGIWHVSNIVRGVALGRPDQVVALGVGIGLESLIVNQGLKRLFKRRRPTSDGDERFDIRTPLTSSFPSGHASAAAFAATTLITWDGKRSIPLWATLAATVAVSRPFVRIHHGSDIVGGVAAGVTMALVAGRVYRRLGIG
ncbi:MAG: hypothetical protein CL424_04300 [Acidimicrobiaceae bacterium]|nr:hypothetical protein [Acidimicrobiaceae bacterium]